MFLLVGLGNPGQTYEMTRHNVGYLVIDRLLSAYPDIASGKKQKFNSTFFYGQLGSCKVALLQPLLFMNNSGKAVAEAARFYKLEPEQIIIFHDDLDLIPGKIKVKRGGGSGGHNGLKSIDQWIGKNYCRVRIGIGHPAYKNQVHSYVLGNFSAQEYTMIIDRIDTIIEHIFLLFQYDYSAFLNKLALTT